MAAHATRPPLAYMQSRLNLIRFDSRVTEEPVQVKCAESAWRRDTILINWRVGGDGVYISFDPSSF